MRRFFATLATLTALALPTSAQDTEAGGKLFFDYCAGCHGADARGTGPIAEMLAIAPPDLTRLSARDQGVFPTFFIVVRIDGRHPIMAHGGEMPVFGHVFEGEDATLKTPAGQPIMTSKPIVDLVAWLESVQE